MITINRIVLAGNVVNNPASRILSNNRRRAIVKLAIADSWKDSSGKILSKKTSISVFCYGAMADNCEKYLTKGKEVMVEGRIENDDTGKIFVNAANIVFLENSAN